ncbi:RAMP superfamily CRISPR-associated protein [Alkalilimnicola ehrlichii]|uniref:RAMP superfamily CRISPR-associated protein n=1 Tax=Alkalilimnicola ehrlichii TaxID=351052 RepID=UPI003BA14CF0
MKGARLRIDLRSYWHSGGGTSGGATADALVQRDAHGLPVVPGRHLKGLLREAVAAAGDWGWSGYTGLAEHLFGERSVEGERVPAPGCLRVGDARLRSDLADWLAETEEGRALRPGFYRTLHATAIDHRSGTALDRSLRGVEVTVPLQLVARVTPVSDRVPAAWMTRLGEVLPLIRAVGAQRSRGLGRAVLTLEEEAA